MLSQFQTRYPTGSLISELLTIYQGKFVVRVAVQIDGVIRATGMAADETPEVAEDKARSRAIALLAIDPAPATESEPLLPTSPEPEAQISNAFIAAPETLEPLLGLGYEPPTPPSPVANPTTSTLEGSKSKRLAVNPNQLESEDDVFGKFGMGADGETESSTSPKIAIARNVSPIASPSYPQPLEAETQFDVSEPIDLSEDLVKIAVKLNELKWTPDQEREYLERTYGHNSRQQLTAKQVQDFSRYLELFSQTTQTSKELKELGWSNQRGRSYLAQTYNKQFRHELTYQQLGEFQQYLQAERDRLSAK